MTVISEPEEKEVRPTDSGADSEAFGGATSNINGLDLAPLVHAKTLNAIIESAATKYLVALDPDDPPHPFLVESDLIDRTNGELRLENMRRVSAAGEGADRNNRNELPLMKVLSPSQVAQVLVRLHRVVRLISSDEGGAIPSDNDPLVIYRPLSGIYIRSEDAIAAAAAKYSSGGVQFLKDVNSALRVHAPHLRLGTSREWAAVANGDYHRATGQLHPFSPERVFMSRVPVAYKKNATNPMIHNDEDGTDWDVDSGIAAIANGNSETEKLLWELFAAVAQPNVRTNKAVALHNPVGNNGKGTILQILRGIAGGMNTLNASVATLAKDATLPLLSGKSLVISDENATNDFVKNAEVIKMLATREAYFVNPKYQQPYNETFEGNQVHCLNALPRFGDHTDSMWRRWLFIPLTAEFEGRDRKYIKDDYLHRPEVLEYILRNALEMKFVGFSETEDTRKLLNAAKLQNDAARQFWAELESEFVWDLLPFEMLYELFKTWFARNKPSGRAVDRSNFEESIRSAVKESGGPWIDLDPKGRKKASGHMAAKEPLLREYALDSKWERVDRAKQYRTGLFRDRVAIAKASALDRAASALVVGPVTSRPSRFVAATSNVTSITINSDVTEINRLLVEDFALWERRAKEDDGVTDSTHIRDHAAMRRSGTSCGGCKRPQLRYVDEEFVYSRELDAALSAATAANWVA